MLQKNSAKLSDNMRCVDAEGEEMRPHDTVSFSNTSKAAFQAEMARIGKEGVAMHGPVSSAQCAPRPVAFISEPALAPAGSCDVGTLSQDGDDSCCATEVMASPEACFKKENRWESADERDLPVPGTRIGHYEIISEIGRGGFGAVYRVRNAILGRDEALKIILPSAKHSVHDVDKRFNREINIVSRLEHPNIVRLYSAGRLEHNIVWMSMELIRGEQLGTIMGRDGAMRFERAKSIMLQVLSGIQDAHEAEIVHRDLKPSNIIISKRSGYPDLAVVLDFGLSKAMGQAEDAKVQNVTMDAARCLYGTPNYMAPELFSLGSVLTPSVDVYAAGLIFLEMLTGRQAYSGTVIEVACAQRLNPVPIPEDMRGTPVAVVIQKACEKLPHMRYQNAGEFFDALQKIDVPDDSSPAFGDDAFNASEISGAKGWREIVGKHPFLVPVMFWACIGLSIVVLILLIA